MSSKYEHTDDIFDADLVEYWLLCIIITPAAIMLITSMIFLKSSGAGLIMGSNVEIFLQSFSAGMIVGSIMSELSPIMSKAPLLGESIGIFIGLVLLHLLSLVEHFYSDNVDSQAECTVEKNPISVQTSMRSLFTDHVNSDSCTDCALERDPVNMKTSSAESIAQSASTTPYYESVSAYDSSGDVGCDSSSIASHDSVHSASSQEEGIGITALFGSPNPLYKRSMFLLNGMMYMNTETKRKKLMDMHELVHSIHKKSSALVMRSVDVGDSRKDDFDLNMMIERNEHRSKDDSQVLTISDAELLADSLDMDLHVLEYYIHHFRRTFIEGSIDEYDIKDLTSRHLLNKRHSKSLILNVDILRECCISILNAFHSNMKSRGEDTDTDTDTDASVTPGDRESESESLKVIMHNLQKMDVLIHRVHNTVDSAAFYFMRRKAHLGAIPVRGSKIPPSLVVPTVTDGIIDGLLLGMTSALSLRVGVVLSLVNCVEMGTLGAAFASRIKKCDGSRYHHRVAVVCLPPLALAAFGFIGNAAARSVHDNLIVLGFAVGFAVVNLFHLSGELLGDAMASEGRSSRGSRAPLYFFAGMWLTLALDRLVQ